MPGADVKHRAEQGYVLVLTIWMLAIMTLAVSYFSLWMDELVADARATKQDLQAQRDMVSTRSVLYYILSTTKPDHNGYRLPEQVVRGAEEPEYLRLDGRPYLGVGDACFSLQDEGGLVRLRQLLGEYNDLLQQRGVPQGEVQPLTAKLQDYMDTDTERHINGAEAPEYEAAGRPEPPNRPLLTSWELGKVLDWQAYPGLWEPLPLPRLVSAQEIGGVLNFNFAPRELLLVIDGVGQQEADALIAAREEKPFRSTEQIFAAAGKILNVNEMELVYGPSRFIRVTLWSRQGYGAQEIVYEVERTESGEMTGPIARDYVVYPPRAMLGEELIRKADELTESVF